MQTRFMAKTAFILLSILTLGGSLLWGHPLMACPSFVLAKELGGSALGVQRSSLRFFAWTMTKGQQAHWTEIPLQIDPLDENGILIPLDVGWENSKVSPLDRLSFNPYQFGQRMPAGGPSPCGGKVLAEFEDRAALGHFGYLVSCPGARSDPTPKPTVLHAPEKNLISSDNFQYEYHPKNQLMFTRMTARVPKTAKFLVTGSDAEMLLHLNFKHFFSMDFTNDDIENYVESTHLGEIGLVGRTAFYLRLLFKIDLKMSTLANFFESSGNIPMLIDIPLDGPKILHPGSGMLYSWSPEESTFKRDEKEPSIPDVEPAVIKKGLADLARLGLKHCRPTPQGSCTYSLEGLVETLPFRLEFNIPRKIVEKGFFPMFVTNVGKFKHDMRWSEDAPDTADRRAFYFECSGLPAGRQVIDYWIKIGTIGNTLSACPHPINISH